MAGEAIQIKFVGSELIGERIIGEYVWNKANDFITAVDVETVAKLITYPKAGQKFEVVAGQKVSPATISKLVELTGASEAEIRALFAAAEPSVPADKGDKGK